MTAVSDGDLTLKWVEAVNLDDFWEGEIIDLEVEGDEVLLVHLEGQVIKAFQGMCPHQEVLLADGVFDQETGKITCGGHAWEFDLTTGNGINPAGCVLFEFPVRIHEGDVLIGIPQDGQRHYNRCPGN